MAQSLAATEAQKKVHEGDALLVCAYDDVNKCRKLGMQEAGDLRDFQAQIDLMRDREVLFICG